MDLLKRNFFLNAHFEVNISIQEKRNTSEVETLFHLTCSGALSLLHPEGGAVAISMSSIYFFFFKRAPSAEKAASWLDASTKTVHKVSDENNKSQLPSLLCLHKERHQSDVFT